MRALLLLLVALPAAVLVAAAGPAARAQPAAAESNAMESDAAEAAPPAFEAPPEGRPLRGVVWRPGPDRAQAVRALRQMKAAGVEAVRTPLIRREALLAAADTLRLRLFQDLPAAYLSAGGLAEALPDLRWELERALLVARRHPSARHFGLLRRSDTSVPAVCAVLRELAARARAYGPPGAITYYETPFIEEDRCRGAADLTLLGALNHERPQALLRRWREARAGAAGRPAGGNALPPGSPGAAPVGIGALGTWVDPAAEGLRAPHSPAAQARYFEEHLPRLLGGAKQAPWPDSSGAAGPAVVFAYRWRDVATSGQEAAGAAATPQTFALEDPYGRPYGLHDAAGKPRPALKVVRGFYTGRQRVFAFDAGEAPGAHLSWLMLVGWGVVAGLGIAYAGVPRFRSMAQRYFTSPGFYRDAVRQDRDGTRASSLVLLAAVSVCSGLVATVFLMAVQDSAPFVHMLRGASGGTQRWVWALLQQPWQAVLVVAAFYFGGLGAWAFFLAKATQRSYALHPAQTLALVAWPRWPVFVLAGGAVIAATLPPGWMLPTSGFLVAAWVLASFVGAARALYDLVLLAKLSPVVVPTLALLNPVLLAAILAFFAALEFLPEVGFLWHLATRS